MLANLLLRTPEKSRGKGIPQSITPMAHNHLAPGLLLTKGLNAFRKNDFETCTTFLESYLELVPNNITVKLTLIECLLSQQKYQSALDASINLMKDPMYQFDGFKLSEIYLKMMEEGIIAEEIPIGLNRDMVEMARRVVLSVKRGKDVSKARFYSDQSLNTIEKAIGLICIEAGRGLESLLTDIYPVLASQESVSFPSLHLKYLDLLVASNIPTYLSAYVQRDLNRFSSNKEWINIAHAALIKLQTSAVLSLQLACRSCILSMDSEEPLELQACILAFTEELINSNQTYKPEDGEASLKEWAACRQEMIAYLSLFEAVALIRDFNCQLKLSRYNVNHLNIKKALDSLFLCLSYTPAIEPSLGPYTLRLSIAMKFLNSVAFSFRIDWVLEGDGEPFNNSTPSHNCYLRYPSIPDTVWSSSPILQRFKALKENAKKKIGEDVLSHSLSQLLDSFIWQLEVVNLKSHIIRLFPIMKILNSNSEEKNSTPTICDVEAFLALLMLESQLTIKSEGVSSYEELVFLQSTRIPTLNEGARQFWESFVSLPSRGNFKLSQQTAKLVSNGIAEIRGNKGQGLRNAFGLIGVLFFEIKEYSSESRLYLDLYESLTGESMKLQELTLFSSVLAKAGSIMDLSRLSSAVDKCYLGLEGRKPIVEDILYPSLAKISPPTTPKKVTPAKSPLLSPHVRIGSKLSSLRHSISRQSPQMKSGVIPGSFPLTPLPLAKHLNQVKPLDTPTMLKSVPGFFPVTPAAVMLNDENVSTPKTPYFTPHVAASFKLSTESPSPLSASSFLLDPDFPEVTIASIPAEGLEEESDFSIIQDPVSASSVRSKHILLSEETHDSFDWSAIKFELKSEKSRRERQLDAIK